MIRNITDEQGRHLVDILKKKSELIKTFHINLRNTVSQEIEKPISRSLKNY